MELPDEREWAAAYYRVERDSTGLKASKRKLRRIAEEAARHGDPIPEHSHDVVRILDREGSVVMERDWGSNRQAAIEEEAHIVDDLLKLDVFRFRAKYGIAEIQPDDAGSSGDVWSEVWSDTPQTTPPEGRIDGEAEGKPEGAPG